MTIKFKKILEDAVQPVRVVNNGTGYNLVAKDIATVVKSSLYTKQVLELRFLRDILVLLPLLLELIRRHLECVLVLYLLV